MKGEIRQLLHPINVLGKDEFMPLSGREVFINDEPCPPDLERIILAGLDALAAERINSIQKDMEAL